MPAGEDATEVVTAGGSGVTRGRVSRVLADVVRFDRSKARPAEAARATFGVAVPLVIGVASGQIAGGLSAAVGAMSAGFASFQGIYRSRALTVMSASVGMAAATFTGELAGRSAYAIVPVAALWGFAAGLLVVLGQAATVVGLQWVVALLVVSEIPATATQAAVRAGLVLAGGLGQTLLLTVVWPLRRHAAERAALATMYSSLADYALSITRGSGIPPEPGSPHAAARTLADPQPFARSADIEWLGSLFELAEGIRSALASLALYRMQLAPADRAATDALARETAGRLADIAATLGRARAPTPGRAWARAGTGWPLEGELRRKLRSALELAAAPAGRADGAGPVAGRIYLHLAGSLRSGVATLRANLTLRSTGVRHAVRLGVVMLVATTLSRLPFVPHGYWLPLTALVVLKPDFSTTMSRGVARVIGTLLGAGLATLLAATLRPGPEALVALVVVAAFAGYLLVRANYAMFAVCITSYVVFLLALAGLPELTLVGDRAVDTIAGGCLALLAYLAWPTWEVTLAAPVLAELLESLQRYGTALLTGAPAGRVGAARAAARLARSNAEASVERMRAEPPVRRGLEPAGANALLAAARQYVLAGLALEEPRAGQQLGPLAEPLAAGMTAAAEVLRAFPEPPATEPPGYQGVDTTALVGELEPLVQAGVDLMAEAVDAVLAATERAVSGPQEGRVAGLIRRVG